MTLDPSMFEDSTTGGWADDRGTVGLTGPTPKTQWTKSEGTDGFDAYTVAVMPAPQGGQVVILAGDDGERRSMNILNTTANTSIVVGKRTQVASGQGFLLPSGTLLPLTTVREVCAWVPFGTTDTTTRVVSVSVERNKN